MLSPELFDRYFAPRMRIMFDEFKRTNPDIKLAWHSCGSVVDLIPRFIDLGVDILNPIQPLAEGMDPQWLKQTYGDKLAFFGGICVQELLPRGTQSEIINEVRRRMGILGGNGGYIVAPAHNIQDDTPVENILAFFEACRD
jgi:uroporphyrinogen decarboxylase